MLMELIPALLLAVVLLAREYTTHSERKDWAAKEATLLQRIQAPEVAVVSHATEEPHEPVNGMPLFSDEDYQTLSYD